jgi:hypothetical protein
MAFDWSSIFDNYGIKEVTRTDKRKSAYVLNEDQREAMSAAGHEPVEGGNNVTDDDLITANVLFDPGANAFDVSYYNSLREEPGRSPETRMGRGIVGWMEIGDLLVLGNIGRRIYLAKADEAPPPVEDIGRELARKITRGRVIERAQEAGGRPERRDRVVADFVRDPLVVAGAIARANGVCETPGCRHETFRRDDGSVFLEVHHITPLGEGGDDTLANAAALCPMCHRELHYGAERMRKREILRDAVNGVESRGR